MYCWMCKHITRMIAGVLVAFVVWTLVFEETAEMIHMRIPRDFVGKAG
jgi:hypothetical protein